MLPLGAALPGARVNVGQGARIAGKLSGISVAMGTLFSFAVVGYLLRMSAVKPIAAALVVMLFSGLYYKHRIGGITGDCFGATSQLTLFAVYVCGVWHR